MVTQFLKPYLLVSSIYNSLLILKSGSYIAGVGLEPLTSLSLASNVMMIGMSHCAWLPLPFSK